jgi:hypothetical protein
MASAAVMDVICVIFMAADQLHWCKNAFGQCYYAIFQYSMSHKHYGHFIYYVMVSAAVTDQLYVLYYGRGPTALV